jgi:hypothetical protein
MEAQAAAGRHLNPCLQERRTHGLPVVDRQTEVTTPIGLGRLPNGQCEKLISKVDPRHPLVVAAQLELKEAPIPGQRLTHVCNLERYVIDADRTSHYRRSYDLSVTSATSDHLKIKRATRLDAARRRTATPATTLAAALAGESAEWAAQRVTCNQIGCESGR